MVKSILPILRFYTKTSVHSFFWNIKCASDGSPRQHLLPLAIQAHSVFGGRGRRWGEVSFYSLCAPDAVENESCPVSPNLLLVLSKISPGVARKLPRTLPSLQRLGSSTA